MKTGCLLLQYPIIEVLKNAVVLKVRPPSSWQAAPQVMGYG